MSNNKKKWLHANRKKSTTNLRTITVSAELAEFIEANSQDLEKFVKTDHSTLFAHRATKELPENEIGVTVVGKNPKINLLRVLSSLSDHYSEIDAMEYDNILIDESYSGIIEDTITTTLELEQRFLTEKVDNAEDWHLYNDFTHANLEKVDDHIKLLSALLDIFSTYLFTGEDSHIAPYSEILDSVSEKFIDLFKNDYNTVIQGGDNSDIFEKLCQNYQSFKTKMIEKHGGLRGEKLIEAMIEDELAKIEQKLTELSEEFEVSDDGFVEFDDGHGFGFGFKFQEMEDEADDD